MAPPLRKPRPPLRSPPLLTESRKALLVSLLLTLLIVEGLVLLGRGVTGYTLASYYQDTCTQDVDCRAPQVCCSMPKVSFGQCAEASQCSELGQSLYERQQSFFQRSLLPPERQETLVTFFATYVDPPQRIQDSYTALGIGGSLLVVALFWMLFLQRR